MMYYETKVIWCEKCQDFLTHFITGYEAKCSGCFDVRDLRKPFKEAVITHHGGPEERV